MSGARIHPNPNQKGAPTGLIYFFRVLYDVGIAVLVWADRYRLYFWQGGDVNVIISKNNKLQKVTNSNIMDRRGRSLSGLAFGFMPRPFVSCVPVQHPRAIAHGPDIGAVLLLKGSFQKG
jgi:hypothetical protein